MGRTWFGPAHTYGPGPDHLKREEKIYWANIGAIILGRYWPTFFLGLSLAHLSGLAQPTYLILYNIYYIIILYVFLKTKTNFTNHFKKIVIFSNIFLPILHNIGLYIYTLKYKSGIKIPSFLWNISKKIQNILKIIWKTFKLISLFKNKKYIFCFHAYDQILKIFNAYFH